ncbi:MAG: trigger factor [Patescibacteria group bacterium]|jgi:trigger factor
MQITYSQNQEKGTWRFVIDHADIASYRKEIIADYQTSLNVKGFRPGKIPLDIIEQRIGSLKLTEEALEKALPDFLEKATQEHHVDVYGRPDVKVTKITLDAPIEMTVQFVKLPTVTLKTYEGLNIEKKKVTADEKDVVASLEEFRNLNAKETEVTRPSKLGDKVKVNFDAFLDNIPLEGGSAKDHTIHLGESKQMYIQGFEEQFVGMKPGDIKDFTLMFPKDYGRKDLANRKVDFKAKVHKVFNVEKPELTDDLAKKFGDLKTVDDLRQRIRQNLQEDADRKEEQRFEQELIAELLKKNDFESIPQEMITDETERMIAELESSVTRQGGKFDDYLSSIKKTKDGLKKELITRAIERIKTALLLRDIAEKHNLEAKPEDIEHVIAHEKEHHANDKETVAQIDSTHYRRHVANVLTSQNVIHYLKEHNTPSKKT